MTISPERACSSQNTTQATPGCKRKIKSPIDVNVLVHEEPELTKKPRIATNPQKTPEPARPVIVKDQTDMHTIQVIPGSQINPKPDSQTVQLRPDNTWTQKVKNVKSTAVSFSQQPNTNANDNQTPPIVLRDKSKWPNVCAGFKIKNLHYVRAQNRSDGISIHPPTEDDYRGITKYFDTCQIPYHTF